ncbi:MAG: hypothetical protein QMC74_15170 [Myxococcota bacterium]
MNTQGPIPDSLRQRVSGLKVQLRKEISEARSAGGAESKAAGVLKAARDEVPWYAYVPVVWPFFFEAERQAVGDAKDALANASGNASKEEADVTAVNSQIDSAVSQHLRTVPGSNFSTLESQRKNAKRLLGTVQDVSGLVRRAIDDLETASNAHSFDNITDMMSDDDDDDGFDFSDLNAMSATSDASDSVSRVQAALPGLKQKVESLGGIHAQIGNGSGSVGNSIFDWFASDNVFLGLMQASELSDAASKMSELLGQLQSVESQASAQLNAASTGIRRQLSVVRDAIT